KFGKSGIATAADSAVISAPPTTPTRRFFGEAEISMVDDASGDTACSRVSIAACRYHRSGCFSHRRRHVLALLPGGPDRLELGFGDLGGNELPISRNLRKRRDRRKTKKGIAGFFVTAGVTFRTVPKYVDLANLPAILIELADEPDRLVG